LPDDQSPSRKPSVVRRILTHPGLSRRPRTPELSKGAKREKVAAVCGVVLALGGAAGALLYFARAGGAPISGVTTAPPTLPAVGVPAALGIIVLGAAFLDFGWPLYRLTVILTGLSLGAGLLGGAGWLVAGQTGMIVGGALGGALGAVAAWPAEVLVRTLSGTFAGLVVGLAAGSALGGGIATMVVSAVIGIAVGGLLTFLVFRPLMMTVFAITGASLIVYGVRSAYFAGESDVVEITPLTLLAAAALAVVGIAVQRAFSTRADAARKS
jgi:hypothetical protein